MARVAGSGERRLVPASGRLAPRHTGTWVLRTNTASFYLRSRITLRPDRLVVEMHRTILGLVPFAKITHDVPLDDLTRVAVRLSIRPVRLVVAVGLGAAVLLLSLPVAADVGLVLLGIVLLFLGVALGLRVEARTADPFTVPICVVQRGVAAAAVRQIQRALAAQGEP